jgi:hypothetical protein
MDRDTHRLPATHTCDHDTIGKSCHWSVRCACVRVDVVSGPVVFVFVSWLRCCVQYCIWVFDLCVHFTLLQIVMCFLVSIWQVRREVKVMKVVIKESYSRFSKIYIIDTTNIYIYIFFCCDE